MKQAATWDRRLGGLILLLGQPLAMMAATPVPRFDVAEVKVDRTSKTPASGYSPSGQIYWRGATMRTLIRLAFKETHGDNYVRGGPAWMDVDRYDVEAKVPQGTPVDLGRLMLQTLLVERFNLTFHREEKPMPVYVMAVDKKGSKLKGAAGTGDPVCGYGITPENVYYRDCRNITMSEFADQLPGFAPLYIDRPVLDQTGLKGSYDFRLSWTPRNGGLAGLAPGADPAVTADSGLTIFGSMEHNLGLRLEERKQVMTTIVIETVERVPVEDK